MSRIAPNADVQATKPGQTGQRRRLLHAARNTQHILHLACIILSFHLNLSAAEIDTSKLPTAADIQIDFTRDIQPILQQNCIKCHGPERPKSHFSLISRESALKGGDSGVDIIPGDSTNSPLVHFVAGLVEDMHMPPPEKGEPLTPEQVGLLRAWIDQGVAWAASAQIPELEIKVVPTVRWITVEGDEKKFREIEGVKENFAGGIEHFSSRERTAPDQVFSIEGHAIPREQDYQLKLALEKTDVGFIRGGVEVWRKYYDDSGGFGTNSAIPNSFDLDRDLHLDIGRVWFDMGLTLPNRPQVVLGYEYQFKQGDKSTLQWGPVGTMGQFVPGTDAKNIFPASKHIDENVQIIKLDLSHEFYGWRLENNARVEFYNLDTVRKNANVTLDSFSPAPDTLSRIAERETHTQGMNTFSLGKRFKDWLFVSGGYLYSRLEGDAAVSQSTLTGSGTLTNGTQWFANDITLKRESHVASISSLLGPWAGLTLSIGAQGEWTWQESLGNENLLFGDPGVPPSLSPDPALVIGKMDSTRARENVSLRFVKIPYTVLFAEARLEQENLGRFEQRPDGSQPFTRDTDADIQYGEYRAGFNSSPWTRLSLGASFKHSLKQTDYNHVQLLNSGGYLYPGFLLWRDIEDNQVQARAVLRVTPWLRTTFTYRYQETDFDSSTAGVPGLSTGGPIDAGHQRSHVYSASAMFTPVRRLYLSTTFSYTDSRATTAQNGADFVVPYQGNIYSVLSSATFALNPKTDLRLAYAYSKSDYGQDNQATGLPAGINYERHNLQAGVTRRFTKNVATSLTYGFFQYREPTSGGANDYTAHAVFATAAISWP